MRHDKMEERKLRKREVKDGHYMAEIGADGGGGVYQYVYREKERNIYVENKKGCG